MWRSGRATTDREVIRLHPQREKLVALMRSTLNDNEHWDYRAIRPLYVYPTYRKGMHVNSDCSFGCKLLCKWAGVRDDPTGENYTGYGNSSSIATHLRHVEHASDLEPGDIVTSGSDGANGHAAMVLVPGNDPLMWSDGHEGAPNTYRLSADTRRKIFCRLNVGPWKRTKADILRSKTGYWSWLQWSLGEGDWRKYPPFAEKVRPNVPEKISKAWWNRRKKFLAARSEGNKTRFGG